MIRIGFSRWFVAPEKKPLPNGRVMHSITMRPQGLNYRILATEWHGLRKDLVEKEVKAETFSVSSVDDVFGMSPIKEIALMRRLASEIASLSVVKCLYAGIVDQIADRLALTWIVESSIMRSVEHGIVDVDESVETIDLVADMRALAEQREAEARERLRQEEERRQQYLQDAQAHWLDTQGITATERKKRMETSFELLFSVVSKAERKECEESGFITVKNAIGVFKVPITQHGLVKQFSDDGKYITSHCIVFQDYFIPAGDEALMKIALLKTDPARFVKTSNKTREHRMF